MHAWTLALLGGSLIGASASLAWSAAGQVAGISGILGGFVRSPSVRGFHGSFLAGLLLTSAMIALLNEGAVVASVEARPLGVLLVSGLLVGFGTRLGGGCTSGHGVCGLSRLSKRSLAATSVFMLSAALVVLLTRHVLGVPS
jgi:uncharacterized membrane protein YedE/YeeE